MKKAVFELSLSELKTWAKDQGMKPFVAKQVFDWVYQKNINQPEQMKNIGKANQETLSQHLQWSMYQKVEVLKAKDQTATKLIMTLHDQKRIECVILREKTYNTLCVSSQCGCPVDCKFCVTGINGYQRNLTQAEIVEQIFQAQALGYPISNLVFMGMGEPLLNYDHVFAAIDHLTDEETFNISKRKITVSTSGYLKHIKRLAEEARFINLAFSVGSPVPEKREKLMPIEKRNPILEVARHISQYQKMHNRKLTLEYTLLDGQNDSDFEISQLANLSKYLNAKVNLINLNPHHKIPFEPVSNNKLAKIKNQLLKYDVPVTVRLKKGQDISAACGQLGDS